MSTNVSAGTSAHSTIVDPLGPLGLTAKVAKKIATGDLRAVRVIFTASGFESQGEVLVGGEWKFLPLVEALASIKAAKAAAPVLDWDKEKAYLVGKFETRLDMEAPASLRSAKSEKDFNAATEALPFRVRQAFGLSNREFEKKFTSWVNGEPQLRSPEEIKLWEEQQKKSSAKKSVGKAKGRGKGSFRGSKSQKSAPSGSA
jgi:hypothetical protein